MGLMGAAWGTAISLAILCIVRIFQIKYFYKVLPFEIKNLKSILSGVFAFGAVYLMHPILLNYHFVINLVFSSIIVIFVYLGFLYILKLEQEDLDVIQSIKIKIKGA